MSTVKVSLLICLLALANVNVQSLPQVPNGAPLPPYPTGAPLPPPFPTGAPLPPPFSRPAFPPPPPGTFVPIIQQNFDINPDGAYTFGYQSADGSVRQESGSVRYPNVPGVEPILAVQGSYAYTAPDGQQIEVQYIADENGFQPSGPYVHPAIQKAVALQVAEAKAQAGLPPNVNGGIPRPFPPPPFPSPFPSPLPYRPNRR
ncbi:endocuticle structural glycoprotein SgAbd-9-like [Planococcus citri]|uniref:endocuticle structural glycoprotein SgAbd-9-like n=1 Tax=Planococcus citri TaxID=170843 RepID=UPI0031FA2CFB